MGQLIVKALLSGIVIAAASEAARRSSFVGALLVSLPLVSILTLAWLYWDTRSPAKVSDLSWSILWLVIPSLVFFVALPLLIRAGATVPVALLGAGAVTAAVYAVYVVIGRKAGLDM